MNDGRLAINGEKGGRLPLRHRLNECWRGTSNQWRVLPPDQPPLVLIEHPEFRVLSAKRHLLIGLWNRADGIPILGGRPASRLSCGSQKAPSPNGSNQFQYFFQYHWKFY